jgi:multidrug resistance efflux pump
MTAACQAAAGLAFFVQLLSGLPAQLRLTDPIQRVNSVRSSRCRKLPAVELGEDAAALLFAVDIAKHAQRLDDATKFGERAGQPGRAVLGGLPLMKTTIRLVAAAAALIFVLHLVADRYTPYTSNARVKAIIVETVPQVSGYLAAVAVTNAQVVEAGQLLARIDQRPFALQLEKARADLQTATQEVGASSAQVAAAQASLAQEQAMLENARAQSQRTFQLERDGVASHSAGDKMRADLLSAEARVRGAQADLERAQQQLGAEGTDNPHVRAALAAVHTAELNLQWTELRAPTRGIVLDLQVDEGTYAHAGQTLMTFVSFDDVWVEAYMTENNLGRIARGNPVELTLDVYPGRIFEGVVSSITAAAAVSGPMGHSNLPQPPKVTGWMRDPQRFPVRITMRGYEVVDRADIRRNFNGQADVVVYTGGNSVLNALAAVWIRLMSWLSYAY